MTKTKPDYLALLNARVKGSTTRTVKRPICLKPELLDDLQRISQALQNARFGSNRYAGGDAEELKVQHEELKAEVLENSVGAIFEVPTPEVQAKYSREVTDANEEAFPPIARKVLSETFRTLVDPDGIPIEFTKEQFRELAESMWSGELQSIFLAIMSASTGEPDFL